MGLAGRKLKQRIGNDPRNLSWADDANKFGTAYLSKLGWSSGSGLGTNGDGMTSHIKVNQKLDMLGIGAAHQKDPNGIAWKQNKDFENLLKRLNAGGEGGGEEVPKVDGFAKAKDMTEEEGTEKELGEEVAKKRKRVEGEDNGKKKKSKATDESDEDATEKKKSKKKSKVSDGLKKSKKERNRDTSTDDDDAKVPSKGITPVSVTPTVPRPFRAHRARFLASKRLASTSSAAVDEILGISRSGTTTPYPSTSIPNTPLDDSSPDSLKLQELTTSSKSVMDYFKEKLLAKSNSASTSITAATTPASPSTPYDDDDDDDDYGDRPRSGLGIGAARGGLGAGSSKLRTEVTFSEEREESGRSGLGSRSRMSVMFTSATTPTSSFVSSVVEKVEVDSTAEAEEESTEDAERPKKSKKGKKDKKCEGQSEQVEEESDTMKKSKKHKSEKNRKAKEGDGDDVVAAVKEDLPSEHNDKKKGKKKGRGTEEIEVKYAISTDSRDVVKDAEDTGEKESKKRKSKRKAETEVALDSDAERKKKKKEKKSKRAQGDA